MKWGTPIVGNVIALEGLHVTGKYRDRSVATRRERESERATEREREETQHKQWLREREGCEVCQRWVGRSTVLVVNRFRVRE